MEGSTDYLQHAISDVQIELCSQPQFKTVVKILQWYSYTTVLARISNTVREFHIQISNKRQVTAENFSFSPLLAKFFYNLIKMFFIQQVKII